MEGIESSQEKSYIDLSVEERRVLLDELIIKPLSRAGKSGKGVYDQKDVYRGYALQDQDSRDPPVLHNLHIAKEMVRRYPGFAKGFIAEHPEVLNYYRKIHLQPIPSQIPAAVGSLVDLLIGQEEVLKLVSQFKVITGTSHLEYQSSQPYIVVYLQPDVSLEQVKHYFVTQFKDFKPSERILRFNQQEGAIVFSAVGDGLFKELLQAQNMLPFYYEEQTNFAVPNPLPKFHENPVQKLIRLGLEKTIKA